MKLPKVIIEPEPEKKVNPSVRKWRLVVLILFCTIFIGLLVRQMWAFSEQPWMYWLSTFLVYGSMIALGIYFFITPLFFYRVLRMLGVVDENKIGNIWKVLVILVLSLIVIFLVGRDLLIQLNLLLNGCVDPNYSCPY
jgi:hypothetical protein